MKDQYTRLREGNIVGIIDHLDCIHSEYTKEVVCHEEFWASGFVRWRWNYDDGIWWIGSETRPNEEQCDAIRNHLTKKYGIKWWDNGYHDLDFFQKKLKEERKDK
jgi:hypothetical protein